MRGEAGTPGLSPPDEAISVEPCVGRLVEADGDDLTPLPTKSEGEHPAEMVSGGTLLSASQNHLPCEAACALTPLIIRYRVRPVARRRRITQDDTAAEEGASGGGRARCERERVLGERACVRACV